MKQYMTSQRDTVGPCWKPLQLIREAATVGMSVECLILFNNLHSIMATDNSLK